MAEYKELIEAIRNDDLVGQGTCSVVDECYDDEAIVMLFDFNARTTPKQAIKSARESQLLHLEMGLNARYGSDDDPELKAYNEFKKAMKQTKK